MQLTDGFFDVPPGKIAAVVTSLEMRERPPARPAPTNSSWTLRQVERPDPAWYRALFRHVGTAWLWSSRLELTDQALAAVIHDPLVEVRTLVVDGRDEGLLELDFRAAGECELGFFGVASSVVGSGAGRWLMNQAIAEAWSRPITRFWVHTCTLDHPGAPSFYMRSGFRPFRRQIEIASDPRLAGLLPVEAGSHHPVIPD
jgi:GNAT superfamily N-acetyltransferase